jgi:hypothetical protein
VLFFAVAAVVWFAALKYADRGGATRPRLPARPLSATLRKRFRRPFPFAWGILTVLVFVGGILYAPNNHTALSYRVPRVLQWIFHHGWFWIHSPDPRVNDRACGLEWLSAPLLLFTKSERLLFLLNFIPFLFVPGMIFALWRHLGVRPRVAYYWMWLLPTSYVFLLQAGSTGNDLFPVIYLLAAMVFAIRARATNQLIELWYSIIAAALALGAKPTCLPLMLPWGLLILGALPLLKRKLPITALVCVIALLVSFLPNALLNIHYCGDWSGANIENAGLAVKNPIVGIWGNAFLLILKNFLPPLFPWAGWWNQHGPELMPQAMMQAMKRSFEPDSHVVGEIPTEEWAGLGLGISVLLLVSFVAKFMRRRNDQALRPPLISRTLSLLVLISFWVALIGFTTKSGMVDAARLAAPYYPFVCCSFVVGAGLASVVRKRWWQGLAFLTVVLALAVLVIVPSRPLFPAETVLSHVAAAHPNSRSLRRAFNVYKIFAERSDPMPNVRALVPPDTHVIGFLGTEDDIDISLWRPFFERRLEYVLVNDSGESVRSRGFRYVVVGGYELKLKNVALDEWLKKVNGKVIAETTATQKLTEGPQSWYLVDLGV